MDEAHGQTWRPRSSPTAQVPDDQLRAICKLWSEAFPTVRQCGRSCLSLQPRGRLPAATASPRLWHGAFRVYSAQYAHRSHRRTLTNRDSFADEWIHVVLDDDGAALAAARTFVSGVVACRRISAAGARNSGQWRATVRNPSTSATGSQARVGVGPCRVSWRLRCSAASRAGAHLKLEVGAWGLPSCVRVLGV